MTDNPHKIVLFSGFLFGAICIGTNVSRAQEALPPIFNEEELRPNEDIELLTRGPLHEAFATSAPLEPQPGIVVQKQPPADVQELPPTNESVDGNEQDTIWIPGYWSWDDEREDYIWVSGAWRIAPVDRRWVPGYWSETSEGWQWVSGFWASAAEEQLDYVEPPPPTLEAGPSIPAPAQNHFWIPGTWIYQSHAYNWRPGYWCPFEENRVWTPAHYVWTPSGCLFVDGYWDYVLPQRGYLYAPVYFHHPVTYYRPSCGVRLSNLLLHLFVSRHHHNYFFGDYYDDGYRHRGRYPLHQYHLAARHYDPFMTYYDAHYGRHGIDSRARLRGWHDYYSSHPQHRPPRTWSAQLQFTRDKDAHRYYSRTALAFSPKPHRGGDGEAHRDKRSERDRIGHEQFRDMAKQRKEVEARNKNRLADSDRRSERLRLPEHRRANTKKGELNIVNTGARERAKLSREDRVDTGRASTRASSLGDQREIGNADRELRKRGKKDLAGRGRNRLDGSSQGTVDVGPQVRAALQDRGQAGELLRSRDKTSFRTKNTGKQEVRKPETSLPPASQRAAVEERQPPRTLRLSSPQADTKSRAKSSLQSANPSRSLQQSSSPRRGDLQPQLDAGRSRQKASSASRSQQTTSRAAAERRQPARALQLGSPQTNAKSRATSPPQNANSTRNQQQRSSSKRGEVKRQPDVGRSRQKAASSDSSQRTTTRAVPHQRQPARAVERSAPKTQTPARTKSATKSTSSSRDTRQRSSVSSRDVQRQSGASRSRQQARSSRSRQQASSSRAKQPPRAPSHQPSSSRSRGASSARSQSQSRQPQRQSVNRQSSSRQKSSGNRQRQSKSSNNRSGGKKNN